MKRPLLFSSAPSRNSLLIAPLIFLLCFVFTQTAFPPPAFCWDRPFDNAANWGGTGLLETPTARVLGDGVIRFGYAEADPYMWYAGGMGIFKWLEVSGSYTEVKNIPSGLGSAFGANKDKALGLKVQLLPESKRFPAIAIGLYDFHGTQLYDSQYLVISRQIFPLDFTIGLGRGRLGNGISVPFWDEVGLFGGIECAVTDRFHLLAEYNPIEYESDDLSARGVPEGADLPVNFGMRIKLFSGVNLGVSYQRGDTLGVMLHLQAELGKPLTPKNPDPPLWHAVDRRPSDERDFYEMADKIRKAICDAGFRDVLVYTDGKELTAEFENNKYLSNQKAVGRVLRILLFHSPADAKKLTAIVKRRRIPFLQVSVKPEDFENYLFSEISDDSFAKCAEIKIASDYSDADFDRWIEAGGKTKPYYSFGIEPSVVTYFNDPSGAFKGRFGIKPWMETTLWKGAAAYAQYDIPFYSNISSSNEPLPDAVRSDSWLYMDRDYSFDRLLLDQTIRLSDNTFGRLTCGYLEKMYAGAGGEILTFLKGGDLALGIEADWVRKREPGSNFDLLDLKTHTILGNLYYRIPKIDVTFLAQYGRFLAGDRGWMFRVSREYTTGAKFGFWYSYTDTDDFKGFNKGYHNKGIFLSLPARMFLKQDSTSRYNYAIVPWTRDVAASVFHWNDLFRMGSDLMPAEFKKDLSKIKE
jgi:hypothetical protein